MSTSPEVDPARPRACPHLSSYDPLAPQELRNPYPTWADARRVAPVFYSETAELWFITRYEDVLAALRDTETFSSRFGETTRIDAVPRARANDLKHACRRGLPDHRRYLVMTDGPQHHARRKLAQQAFTPRRIAALEPAIEARAAELCEQMASADCVDLMGSFAYPLTTSVIAGILGLGEALAAQMRQVAEDLLVLTVPAEQELSADAADDVIARIERVGILYDAVADEMRYRRRSPRDDVLSALVTARLGGETPENLGDEEVLALAAELILAGTDTTANLIAHAVIFASPQARVWRQLGTNDEMTSAVIEETLRRRGSSRGMFRITTREANLSGVTIPAGATVQLLFGSANHDESRFRDPAAFRLDRAEVAQHIAFGKGTHFCLGAPLARLETCIALQALSNHFPGLRVSSTEFDYAPTMTTHTLTGLDVALR
jgi:cytochrome P450